ncbi:MAG: riboflavin synthase [Candidatus Marinimicrobia bacterium]|nr:riboflavin synthase [Candidatus Neomarinimicrobiota bacterium]
MFTGLIKEIGRVEKIRESGKGISMRIGCRKVLEDLNPRDSISINGVCLTVVEIKNKHFNVDVVEETITRSNIKTYTTGHKVNLERALLLSQRLGGHLVQGHVDGTALIKSQEMIENGTILTVEIPADLNEFVVEKGSISLDGISLTVASLIDGELSVALIPHTLKSTTIGEKKIGDLINVEVDILAKYAKKMLSGTNEENGMSLERLGEMGF